MPAFPLQHRPRPVPSHVDEPLWFEPIEPPTAADPDAALGLLHDGLYDPDAIFSLKVFVKGCALTKVTGR